LGGIAFLASSAALFLLQFARAVGQGIHRHNCCRGYCLHFRLVITLHFYHTTKAGDFSRLSASNSGKFIIRAAGAGGIVGKGVFGLEGLLQLQEVVHIAIRKKISYTLS
jgi:hypothetical protein